MKNPLRTRCLDYVLLLVIVWSLALSVLDYRQCRQALLAGHEQTVEVFARLLAAGARAPATPDRQPPPVDSRLAATLPPDLLDRLETARNATGIDYALGIAASPNLPRHDDEPFPMVDGATFLVFSAPVLRGALAHAASMENVLLKTDNASWFTRPIPLNDHGGAAIGKVLAFMDAT